MRAWHARYKEAFDLMKKALFIGGTGIISTEISKRCIEKGWQLYLLNRGNRPLPEGAISLKADINDEEAVKKLISGIHFDVVADFIVFTLDQLERDIRLFSGNTDQYIFISSASAYQKPLVDPVITESTPLVNPYWQYSRNKAACEDRLMKEFRENGFPFTTIRPSHTYCETGVPMPIHGKMGSFQILERIRQGKPVIVPGDGTSLWTVTFSRDFAKGFCGIMANPHAIGNAYHITSDEHLTWDQIVASTARALGVKPNIVHIPSDVIAKLYPDMLGGLIGDKSNTVWFDNSKIKRDAPEFVCTTRFDDGVRECIRTIYADKTLQVPDPAFDAWCDAVIEKYQAAVETLPAFEA